MTQDKLIISVLIFILSGLLTGCSSGSRQMGVEEETHYVEKGKVVVYYFHRNIRCITCTKIENGAEKIIAKEFPNQKSAGILNFQSINLDDKENKELGRRLHVNGQALVVVNHSQKMDLTGMAFLYAGTQPEKFRVELIKTINELFNKE